MQKVYFDNAATTPLSKEVADAMHSASMELFGNPSSIHSFGRKARASVEIARKNIARVIKAQSSEIIFTSGGTEANNMVFHIAVNDLKVERIITSEIEHYAVLKPISKLNKKIKIDFVNLNKYGEVDLDHLKSLLSNNQKTLVSLMHVNNEIGNILPLEEIASICKSNNALFHSDTIQSIAYFDIDVKKLEIDFLSCSAHKFHGPKGIGFLYSKEGFNISSILTGGNQEKGLRAGTENTIGIIGLEKALLNIKKENKIIFKKLVELKSYLVNQLKKNNFLFSINGSLDCSSPAILNITFQTRRDVSMLLFNLDLEGIAISGGSACTSGGNTGSHVLKRIGASMELPALRISFSTFNTCKEIDQLIAVFKKLLFK
jgi:cysteine desulfurase